MLATTYGLYTLVVGGRPPDATSNVADIESVRPRGPDGAPASARELAAAEQDPIGTSITVRTVAGAPLPGSDVLAWPLGEDSHAWWDLPAICATDAHGEARIDADRLPDSRTLLIRHPGFVPHRLTDVAPGSTHDVVLQRGTTCRVTVVDESGMPVEGFSVALSRTDPPARPNCPTNGAVYHGFGGIARQAHPANFGRTDRGGLLLFEDLLPGRHLVTCNFEQGDFFIANWNECLAVEAPGEVSIRTKDLWAAVVRLVGDDVLVAGFDRGPSSPIALTSETENILALRRANARLEALHSGCRVVVGALANKDDASIRLAVCGRTGGWSTHSVPLSRLRDVTETSILLPPGATDATARTRLHLVNGNTREVVDRVGARATLGWRVDGVTTFVETDFGVELPIPAGSYDISASGELPPGCFAPTRRVAAPGHLDVVLIPLASDLHRYAIQVRRPDGSPPTHFGFSISWQDSVRGEPEGAWRGARPRASMLTIHGDRHTFLSTAPRHSCTVYVKGYDPYRMEIQTGSGTIMGDTETWSVTLPVPAH